MSQFDDFDMYDELNDQVPQEGDFDGAPMDENWQDYADEDSAEDDFYGYEDDGRYDDDPDPYSGTGTW